MKAIVSMFAGGLAWLALGLILLLSLFAFVGLNISEVHSADSVISAVQHLEPSGTALSVSNLSLPADGLKWFSSPALVSYGLGGLVFLWALSQHRVYWKQEGV